MISPFRTISFWIPAALAAVSFYLLELWRLDWISYFRYFSAFERIPFGSPELLLAAVISLLFGWHAGAIGYLVARHRRPGLGIFGAAASGIWLLASACLACNVALISSAGFGIFVGAVAAVAPQLQFISLGLMLVSAIYLFFRLRKMGCFVRPKKKAGQAKPSRR